MKRFFVLFVAVLGAWAACGQSGSDVLGRLSRQMAAMGSYKIDFELEMPTATATSKGYCVVSGERYKIAIEDLMQGCDGTLLWMQNGTTREVTLDHPNKQSRNLFDNPTKAFDFAEELFEVESITTNAGGRWQLVLLPAEGVLDGIERVVVDVDKKSGFPTRLGYDMSGVGLWINIVKIGSVDTSPDDFSVEVPEGFEVIDFR
jgi:outer membrane lipoprotein-sorting protein